MWIPKGAALIRGRRLFEACRLLDELWYLNKPAAFSSRFVQVCGTFLLPPGIKRLKSSTPLYIENQQTSRPEEY